MDKRPISLIKLRQVPRQFSWVDQRLVRERYIDQLSHEACALYLFLLTVADAQGLSYYAERTLSERLSMSLSQLRQARQVLITQQPDCLPAPHLSGVSPGKAVASTRSLEPNPAR